MSDVPILGQGIDIPGRRDVGVLNDVPLIFVDVEKACAPGGFYCFGCRHFSPDSVEYGNLCPNTQWQCVRPLGETLSCCDK